MTFVGQFRSIERPNRTAALRCMKRREDDAAIFKANCRYSRSITALGTLGQRELNAEAQRKSRPPFLHNQTRQVFRVAATCSRNGVDGVEQVIRQVSFGAPCWAALLCRSRVNYRGDFGDTVCREAPLLGMFPN